MSRRCKGRERDAARDVQELTGCDYATALLTLRSWKSEGVRWEDGIARLASFVNEREDALEASGEHAMADVAPYAVEVIHVR